MADPRIDRGALARPGLIAGALAFAGLPLYVHAPKFYAEEMAVGLPVLGAVLLAARAIDSVQDPIIGWLAARLRAWREVWAVSAAVLLGTGIAILFAPPGWGDPLLRLTIGLLAAFTGFSALQIALYDHGLALANRAGGGHTNVALWREVGGLVGICLASLAPPLLAVAFGAPAAYVGYSVIFTVIATMAILGMAGRWQASAEPAIGAAGFRHALSAPGVAPLLGFGFLNALPTAVTSTLFLFFVAEVLQAEIHAGPTLLVFFAAAAAAAPLWARLAERFGRRRALAAGMTLSVLAFAWAYSLGPGDIGAFYVIGAASGAALGADMTLTPAMLASRIQGDGARVFAVWTFLQKSALALGAGITLPVLAFAGFNPTEQIDASGREALTVAYALVPCLLKLFAITALAFISDDREPIRENP